RGRDRHAGDERGGLCPDHGGQAGAAGGRGGTGGAGGRGGGGGRRGPPGPRAPGGAGGGKGGHAPGGAPAGGLRRRGGGGVGRAPIPAPGRPAESWGKSPPCQERNDHPAVRRPKAPNSSTRSVPSPARSRTRTT